LHGHRRHFSPLREIQQPQQQLVEATRGQDRGKQARAVGDSFVLVVLQVVLVVELLQAVQVLAAPVVVVRRVEVPSQGEVVLEALVAVGCEATLRAAPTAKQASISAQGMALTLRSRSMTPGYR
jgi:hypothetical protein